MKQQADKDKTKIDALDAEAEKLQKVIKEADAEKLRQKKELDQVTFSLYSQGFKTDFYVLLQ